MPTFNFRFYGIDPITVFTQTVGGTSIYTGPPDPDGFAVVTDNATGVAGTVLEDDNAGETATGDVTIGGLTSTGSNIDAEEVWTLRDTVTGEVFEVVTFDVENGPAAGDYLLSEIPLVAGRIYETVAYDSFPDVDLGDPTLTYTDYVEATQDGVVEGTSGDDVIDASYTGDPERDLVDANDAPSATPPAALEFNWSDFTDGTDLSGGVSQDTGGVQVDVSYTGAAGGSFTSDQTGTKYSEGVEPFATTSSAFLFQNGAPQNATVTFDFSATAASGNEDAVQGLQFRINDIDGLSDGFNNFQDIVTITAFDADGNEVPVSITITGNDSLSGQTVTGSLSNASEADAAGSILVEIAGPVSQVLVDYDNGGNTQQAIYFSDLHFLSVPQGTNDDVIQAGGGNDVVDAGFGDDTVFGEGGNDTLTGGEGADTLDGGLGDDTLNVGSGDIATGGDGDDTFVIDSGALGGGTITITGGETGETAGDTLDFGGQLAAGSVTITNPDDAAGGKSGTATLLDGTVVNFSEIESIICFAAGTLIDTPHGPREVEELAPGDLVLTPDRGPVPIRWHGRRIVVGEGDAAPIRFGPGTLGNARPLLVSPQHRVLITDHRAQLNFGEDEVLVPAKALVDGGGVYAAPAPQIAYHHLMFDTHEIIWANGVPTESYHPGAYSLAGLGEDARDALFMEFPGLRADANSYGPTARPAVRVEAGRVLAA